MFWRVKPKNNYDWDENENFTLTTKAAIFASYMSMISEAWGSGFIYQKNDEVSEWRYTRGKNPNVIATNRTENFKKHSKTIQTVHTEKLEHPFWISPFQRHKLFSRREKWLLIYNLCMRTDISLRNTFPCRKVVPQKEVPLHPFHGSRNVNMLNLRKYKCIMCIPWGSSVQESMLCQRRVKEKNDKTNKETSSPDFIFSINDSMFASRFAFFTGALIWTGAWSRPAERKLVELRLLLIETWCRGDEGGLKSVSMGRLKSVISSSRTALFEAIKSPSLK